MNPRFLRAHHVGILFLAGSLVYPAPAHGESSGALQTSAIALYREGNYQAAAALYQRIAARNPDNTGALRDLVSTQWLGKQYVDLLSSAPRLTARTPQSLEAWLIYARSLNATGHWEEALRAFERCQELAPHDNAVRFTIARLETKLRNYDRAAALFERLIREDHGNAEVYPELAHVQQLQENYPAAEKNWAMAVHLFPERMPYRFYEAQARYYSGEIPAATAAMKALAAGAPPYPPATEFLINVAVVQGDRKEAERLLNGTLSQVTPDSESRFVRLATLYQSDDEPALCVATVQQVIDGNPLNGTALFLKGECLQAEHKDREAVAVFLQIVTLNPAALRAWTMLAASYAALDEPQEALLAIEKAHAQDPTDPYLLLDHAQYLNAANDQADSKKMLTQWLQANLEAPVPVLLYHGLTPYPQDVLLASAIHVSVASFNAHMKALHDAGFHSITVAQLEDWSLRHTHLPSNPVLISFDDDRIDSLRYADPILKKYGFTATMFAPIVDVEAHLPNYADWALLQHYQQTGRWDIQAHGDRAHTSIGTDAQGHTGLFLVNRQWLAQDGRFETTDEWSRRIADDHHSLKAKMLDHLGTTPSAYAWPDGAYGQDSLSPETAALNLNLARREFQLSFHEDEDGLNPPSRDPLLMTRLQPSNTWSGDQLLAYLHHEDPRTLVRRRLLRQALGSGNTHEALYWMNDMKKNNDSSADLSIDEAQLQFAKMPLLWEPTLMFQKDNHGRERWAFYQRVGEWKTGTTGWSVHQLAGGYQERNTQTVDELNGGVGIDQPLGLSHRVGLDITGHHLTGSTAKDTYSLIGSANSNWTDYFRTEAEGGRTIFNTARALNANVAIRYIDLKLIWTPDAFWTASLRNHFGDFTDTNHDVLEVLQVSRQIADLPLKALLRFTGEDMRFVSPNYYSPQQLQDYQIGARLAMPLNALWAVDLTYLPGIGTEKGTGVEFVQDADLEVSYKATPRLSIRPDVALSHTPSYFSSMYILKLLYNFN